MTASNIAALPTRPFGKTDMKITRVGFGSWAIGGGDWAFGWGDQDNADSIAAIRHGISRGINWIDTAAAYGVGHSEEMVAAALRDVPKSERPYVFTKCGLVPDPDNPEGAPLRVGTAISLRTELENSLRRLQVERIDLYQMHWPTSDGTAIEDYWRTLLDFKREGKVRAVGLSNHSAELLERAERLGHVDTLQPPFSAIKRKAAAAELPWCQAHGTGVIVYSPMQAGLLTGAFTAERAAALPKNDWRSRSPDFQGEGLRRNLQVADAFKTVARRHGTTTAAAAAAWTLAWPAVTGAIVGARRPAQVDGWIDAATLELTAEDLATIAAAIEHSGAGAGPSRPGR